ncbi:hypothetical protein AAFF_G00398150 [Aldrovandia affinis]|uniref:Uncharacterized protein n=1 Tax=Aldrovandia affinis TaxID=143900 RepID=A0AAD7R453_9TELE|nr:hypothetical protein AAFF_G00398150 [Aldrovandia affinis]
MQQINADIEYLKRTTDTQTTACETLRVVSATLDNRLTAVEKPRGQGATSSAASLSAAEIQPGPVPGSSSAVVERPLGPGETEDIQPAQPDDSAQGRTQSPAWSKVVREGRRQKQVPENSDQQRHIPRTVKTLARHERKKTGIIGTGVVSNILAVKTKMVSVFATKFDLNVDADTLSDYLKEKLGREVKCRKIETAQSRFSSFCVTAECNDVAEMYDPQLWPAGSFVRRFYEPRRPRGAVGGPSGPEGTLALRKLGCCPVVIPGCLSYPLEWPG